MFTDFATNITQLFITNPPLAGWLSLCRNVSPFFNIKVAHFAQELVAQFAQEQVAQFTQE